MLKTEFVLQHKALKQCGPHLVVLRLNVPVNNFSVMSGRKCGPQVYALEHSLATKYDVF